MTSLRRRGRGSRGQALAEFAIVFPVFMLMLGGLIQFGIIFWAQNTLTQVARDTGRYAATQQSCDSVAARDLIVAKAKAVAANSSLIGYRPNAWGNDAVTVAWSKEAGASCPPRSNQEVAWVTITLRHRAPIFFPWIPGNGNLSTTAEFRMEPVAR